MYSPNDLEKIEFGGSLIGGYKREEVDEFLTVFKGDYELLYKENISMKDKLGTLEDFVSKYKAMEESLHNSLLLAQKTADEVQHSANERAEIMVKEAQLRIDSLYAAADLELIKIKGKISDLRVLLKSEGERAAGLLGGQIRIIREMIDSGDDNSNADGAVMPHCEIGGIISASPEASE